MWTRLQQLPRFVVAIFLGCGAAVVWGIVGGVTADAVLQRVLVSKRENEVIIVRPDRVVVHFWNNSEPPVDTYRLADGRPVRFEDARKWNNEPWLSPSIFAGPLKEGAAYVPPAWDERLATLVFAQRNQKNVPVNTTDWQWYFLHDGRLDGHGYFVAYNRKGNELVGYLGKHGFIPTTPPEQERFPYDGRRLVQRAYRSLLIGATQSGHYGYSMRTYEQANLPRREIYFLSGEDVWRADLAHLTVELLGHFPEAIDLQLAPLPLGALDEPNSIDEKLTLRTRTEMIRLALDGEVLQRWTLPEEARQKEFLWWYHLGEGRALLQYSGRLLDRTVESELVWLDAQSRVERRQTVETVSGGPEPRELWTMAAVMPVPSVLTAFYAAVAGDVRGPDYPSKFAKALALFWPALVLVYLISAALASLAYRRQVRFSLPGAGGWAAFVFLLGVPGWLAYRWHRRWPVMEACGECHRPAPRDRESCASCGDIFAPPPRLGTEIFA